MVAGFVAAHHPQLIERLVLIAPPALGLRYSPLGLKSLAVAMTAVNTDTLPVPQTALYLGGFPKEFELRKRNTRWFGNEMAKL